ncbi:albumin-like [Mantella aurantiaca]
MKWASLICLLIFSITTESRHLQKRDHEHHPRTIHDIVKQVGKPVVEKLVLVMVAQDFQKCTLDEHLKAREKVMQAVEHCENHPEEADCKKPAMTLYHDIVCKEDVEELYPWTKECCTKEESERSKCFIDHRNVKGEEYKMPDIAEACKEHKEHPQRAFDYFLSNIAKLHGDLYQPAVLGFAIQYNQITGECCAEEDKAKCFMERMVQVKKLTNYVESKHRQTCHIIKSFPERVTQALTLIQASQRFPNADFDSLKKLALEIAHMKKDCCSGNSVECMTERMETTEHICAAKEKLSSKLGICCEKSLLERTPCILALPNDEAELPKDLKEYYEDEHVCENYQKDKIKYLSHFTVDYSKTHQASPIQSCLRVSKGYEGLLEKCCSSENHAECLKEAPKLLDAALKENEELTKQNCGGLAQLGPNDYLIQLLVRYFKKMPQVTAPTLVGLAHRMTKAGVYCCSVADDKKQSCAEEKLDILLGDMCEREKQTFVNDDVHHCCVDSYANRRPCFTKLGPYANYVAPAWDETKLPFTAALCEGSAEDQQKNKLILLVEFLKMKPNCDQEKLKEIVEAFRKLIEKCCEEADHQACYDREKEDILKKVREA